MSASRAIFLVNLGSPDSTAIPDVRKYLDQFLMDERVLDYPYWVRSAVVRGVILNIRPKKSAAAYKEIWWDEGSPLVVISKRLRTALEGVLRARGDDTPVGLGMRYQNPSIEFGIKELLAANPNLKELLLVPLYPQYAMSTTETVAQETRVVLAKIAPQLELKVLPPFFDHPAYIEALAEVVAPHVKDVDHVLFSYHGIPKSHIRKSDCTGNHCLTNQCCTTASPAHEFCYQHQCTTVTEALAHKLGLQQYSMSFQSRLGPGWLTPFTDKRLEQLPKEGIKKLAILCPAFVSDCLETLEEIGGEGKEIFEHAGGEHFKYVPCMNDHPTWVKALLQLCDEAWGSSQPFVEYDSIARRRVAV
jgi:protoporphyrin/coproporphyrin ferrochelatase